MATKVNDLFNGTSGTDIASHTPDTDVVGGGWSQSGANTLELDGSGGLKWSSSGQTCAISAGTADQRVETNFNPGGADNRMSVLARWDGAHTSRTDYLVNFRPGDSGGMIALLREVAGAQTTLGSKAYSINLSTTYKVEIEAIGTAIKVYIDDVQEFSVTDSGVTSGNYGGLQGALRTDANGRFYDFNIDDTTGTSYTLTCNAGSLTLTGQAAGLKAARKLQGEAGSLTISGQAAALKADRKIIGEAGSLSLTGQAANLKAARILSCSAGSLSITGQAATLTKVGTGTYTLTCEAGSYTLTESDAVLIYQALATPKAQTIYLAAEDTTLILVAEDNTLTLAAEDDTLKVH